MTSFVFFNYFFCLLTTAFLLLSIVHDRALIVKPTTIILIFFHVQIQWAAAVYSGFIEFYLSDPLQFAILVHGFPLIGITGSLLIGGDESRKIWARLTAPEYLSTGMNSRVIVWFLLCITLLCSLYFTQISFGQTGLHAILFDSANAATAREASLKLVGNPLVKYGYVFFMTAFAPLGVGLCFLLMRQGYNRKDALVTSGAGLGLAALLILVSISGARSPAAKLVLALFLAYYIRKGVPLKISYIVVAIVVVLAIPTMLSILREGRILNMSLFFDYLKGGIAHRVFIVPMKTALWHTHFVQEQGLVGIAGIRKLALLTGVDPVSLPLMIYSRYTAAPLEYGTSPTCYVFTYYSYFGIWSLPFTIGALWLLDLVLVVYRSLSDNLLLPCVVAVSISSIMFISADFTTVLLSHGFLVVLGAAVLLDSCGSTANNRGVLSSRVVSYP